MSFIDECKNEVDHIHGVVALPGSILLRPPHLVTEHDFQKTIDTNLKTAFSVVRAAGKLLSKSSVVLMSTSAVSIGLANHEMIVAAKAGIESMVKSASLSYAKKELRFNAIAPGLVNTPLSSRIVNNPAALEVSIKMHPSGRIGEPSDISRMICFLLNPENSWITGQTFRVDGGLSATKS
jgi:NAD(P)-dependent dehydrogenase (short-subunit alcohol dehydrogenase family)